MSLGKPRRKEASLPDWARRIKQLRRRLGLNQTTFGARLRYSAMAVSRWECGAQEPTADAYIRLGQLCGKPECWWFWSQAGLKSSDARWMEKLLEAQPVSLREKIRETGERAVRPEYRVVVDEDRRYTEVSDSFCNLVGYERKDVVGKRYDDFTAPNTSDIPAILTLFSKLGYMQGLWIFVSREGTRILVRYEAWLRPDSFIEANLELVDAGYRT
jgi:transcriptional regulator with XRE-family HTH domain